MPKRFQVGFLAVSALTADEFNSLLALLENTTAEESFPLDELFRRVGEAVPGLGRKEAKGLVQALQSVQSARIVHGDSLAGFANDIATSEDLGLTPEEAASLSARIESLARQPAIAITAKVRGITSEHERTFHSVRILTDIRPVFGDDARQPPVGAVVTHALRIDAFRNGRSEDYYVALDNKDLLELQVAVNRAVEKTNSLNGVLDRIGFSRFKISEGG